MSELLEVRCQAQLGEFALDVDINLPACGVTAIFGHSGSGKTSLLRCIAGLQAAEGRVVLKEQVWQDDETRLPVHQRPLAYVFQEASLFPHLSVKRNLEYGYKRVPAEQRRIAFDDAVEWLGLEQLLSRKPDKLSGGERQRVAIARALLTSPELLLMDEPLSALDHASKQSILPYLERLHQTLSIPVLYVTHSPDEVARLADHLVVMEKGKVAAQGALSEVLSSLELPIKLGDEAGVVLEAEVTARDARWHLIAAQFNGGVIWLPDDGQVIGQSMRLRVLARDVSIALDAHLNQSMQNLLPATVKSIREERPGVAMVQLCVASTLVLSRVTARAVDKLQLAEGKSVWIQVKSVAVIE